MDLLNGGHARQTQWACEDGWTVGYTTARIVGGAHDGKFAAFAYKRGSAEPADTRVFSKRKLAKDKAIAMYCQHSPRWAKRHGYSSTRTRTPAFRDMIAPLADLDQAMPDGRR